MKSKLTCIACLLLLTTPLQSISAPNPASQDWVKGYALPQLQSADWAAVCTSGSPASQTGCFGNISSPAFAKLNAGLQGIASYFNIPIANVPNSVFIQQYFGGSYWPTATTSRYATIANNSNTPNLAKCTLYTAQGIPLGDTGVLNCSYTSVTNSDENYYTYIVYVPNGLSNNNLPIRECDSNAPGNPGYMPVVVPVYLLCLGVNNAGTATSLQGISVTA